MSLAPDFLAVVTGASSGIGAATATALAHLGARVVVIGRNPERTRAVERGLPGAGHRHLLVDFASLDAVRELAETLAELPRIDLLVNNAGLWTNRRTTTPAGLEMTFAVNHLAPFLLTTALLERLADSHARVVHVASDLHYTAGRQRHPGWQIRHALESLGVLARHDEASLDLDDLQLEHTPFNGMDAYARSKLAQVAFSNELARRVPAIRSNAVHPGNVNTRVARSSPISAAFLRLGAPLLRTPAEGADTVVWCATAPELEDTSGRYFADRTAKPPAPICEDPAFCSAVWERSMALLHRDEST